MVPPGIPGRSDADFLPPYDPDGRPRAAGRGRLPGRRRLPGDHADDRSAAASTRRSSTELERELGIELGYETMGDGYFDRLAIEPPADVVARLGRRLPGPQRLPGRPARDRRVEQLRPLELAPSSTRRSPRPARRPIPRPRPAAYDRAETIVRDDVPVVPVAYGAGWALSRTGLLGRRPERARDRPDGGPGMGATERRSPAGGRGRSRPASPSASLGSSRRSRRRASGGGLGRRSATPTADVVVRRRHRVQPAGHARPGRSARVELLLTIASAIGPHGRSRSPTPPAPAPTTLAYTFDPPATGTVLPNTPLVARWRLVAGDDPTDVALGPRGRASPTRTTGSTGRRESGDLVRVHWYEGGVGVRASGRCEIGEDGRRARRRTCSA